jgi:hypothetical protein
LENNEIVNILPVSVRERPLDFYTAAVLFMIGIYALFDTTFPERFQDEIIILIIHVIGGYLMAAAALIIATMLCDKVKRPIFAIIGEFYGWMLVVSASVAISLLYLASAFFGGGPTNWITWFLWVVAWIGMAIASFIRTVDLWHTFKVIR